MIRPRPYSKSFVDAELQKVREGEVFVALADYSYIQDLFVAGHYVDRQAKLAVALKKPVLLAFDSRVPEMVRKCVRAHFPAIEKEIEYNGRDPSSRRFIVCAAEEILQRLHPEETKPEANITDAFNDPLHGLERIG